jgi:hypothetical protein
MNRPKNAPLLAALALVVAALGVAASWALWDLARTLDAAPPAAAHRQG